MFNLSVRSTRWSTRKWHLAEPSPAEVHTFTRLKHLPTISVHRGCYEPLLSTCSVILSSQFQIIYLPPLHNNLKTATFLTVILQANLRIFQGEVPYLLQYLYTLNNLKYVKQWYHFLSVSYLALMCQWLYSYY